MKSNSTFLSCALLVSALAFLPACNLGDWGKSGGSCACPHGDTRADIKVEGIEPHILKETVVSMDGKPVVTGEDFEKYMIIMMEGQPALKDMLPYIPAEQLDQMHAQVIENLAMEKLVERWLNDSGTSKTAEFKKNAARAHEIVDRDLAIQAFQKDILDGIKISDEEAKEFYDKNRNSDPMLQRPPFVLTQGGVKAESFEASNDKQAKELAIKARVGNFAEVAKEAGKKVNDYGMVNSNSFIDADVKEAVLKATKFPSVEVVKGSDDKYYVVRLISKQETKFNDFDNVKDAVKHLLTSKKFQDAITQRVAELKQKYSVETSKDYVQKRKPAPVTHEESHEAAPAEHAKPSTPVKAA